MSELLPLDKSEFDIRTLDDEIRVDALCRDLLQRFYQYLLDKSMVPGEASLLASGADYYTRDFVIGAKQKNILDEQPGAVRQFAGNWYITNTLEPNMRELSAHLAGVKAFYGFLRESGLVSDQFLRIVEQECENGAYYRDRIEAFWSIRGDGYFAWEKECTLKDR